MVNEALISKFESLVAKIPFHECHVWIGRLNYRGYGCIQVGVKNIRANRLAWELYKGPIPEGYYVCHHCDNPACVRIEHLFVGTQSDNMKDMWSKERRPRTWGRTKEERLEARREFYKLNADKLKSESKTRRDSDPSYKEKRRAWRYANAELYRQTKQLWRAKRKAMGFKPS